MMKRLPSWVSESIPAFFTLAIICVCVVAVAVTVISFVNQTIQPKDVYAEVRVSQRMIKELQVAVARQSYQIRELRSDVEEYRCKCGELGESP